MKNESAGLALRTRRVRLVAKNDYEHTRRKTKSLPLLTLVALLLDLKLLGEILILLPLDLRADGTIVDKVTSIPNGGLVEVRLLEDLVFEKVVGGEEEAELEARLALVIFRNVRAFDVLQLDVGEVLESISITIGDEVTDGNVVAQGSQPEFRNTVGRRGDILGQRLIVLDLLRRDLFTSLDLLLCGLSCTENDGLPPLI